MSPLEWGLQEGFPLFQGITGLSRRFFAKVSPPLLNKISRDQAIPMLFRTMG
jgi:hypothetical protein